MPGTSSSSFCSSGWRTRAEARMGVVNGTVAPRSSKVAGQKLSLELAPVIGSWSWRAPARSEEHTSELQSPDHHVCRLLLEKKKTSPKHHGIAESALVIPVTDLWTSPFIKNRILAIIVLENPV